MSEEYEIDEPELTNDQRRDAMLKFRSIYVNAKTQKDRRDADITLVGITEGLSDHNEIFPDGDWEHPCACDSCKSYA